MSAPAPSERLLVQRTARCMATEVCVQIAATRDQETQASSAADACMTWLNEVDACLSRFSQQSELSQLNRSAGHWFAASALLFDAVAAAVWGAKTSDGLFDPTLLHQLEALGYDRDFSLIARTEAPHTASTPSSSMQSAWRGIELDAAARRIRLPEHVSVDLGGIAKGWAADVALARFCAPFAGALVNVGGDLRVHGGPEPGIAWSVGVRDPRREAAGSEPATAYLAMVRLSRGGLATSGAVRRWWMRDGQRRHHLLDPRTGRPMPLWIDEGDTVANGTMSQQRIATATALAPTAAHAEVAAKVALLRGYPQALHAVDESWQRYGAVAPLTDADAGVALLLTFGTGEVALSKNITAYLGSWGTDGAALPMTV